MVKRNIGIVRDGETDYLIYRKIVECMLSLGTSNNHNFNIVELKRQKIEGVGHYWKAATNTDEYYLPSEHARKLQDAVANMLTGAFRDFESETGTNSLCCHDVLLITTDTERTLREPEAYFEPWAFSFSKILIGAIEKFYSIMAIQGYSSEFLPIIVSVAAFPSTEIFVGAARNLHNRCYGKKPKELKRLLYNTENISRLKEGELEKQALNFMTPECIQSIFRNVPESRLFIQTLSSLGKSS